MNSSRFLAVVIVAVLALYSKVVIAQLHKCTSNDSVTYQNTPCPPSELRRHPTVEQLNAERKKKLAQASEASASSSALTTKPNSPRKISSDSGEVDSLGSGGVKQYPRENSQPGTNFSCDNRKYCSQMRSCAEATYFLSHCPGVKLDGNRDGIPCEQQWCNR